MEKFEKNNLKRIFIALKDTCHLRNYKRAGRGEKEGTFFCKMKAQMQWYKTHTSQYSAGKDIVTLKGWLYNKEQLSY